MTDTPAKRAMTDEELVIISHSGDDFAKELLYERYKSMVRAMTRTYYLMGADSEDLIQEGMIGLFKAVRDYNPSVGVPFKHFARLCITRHIISAINYASSDRQKPLNHYVSIYSPVRAQSDSADDALLIDVLPDDNYDNLPETQYLRDEGIVELYEMTTSLLTTFELAVLKLFLDGLPYKEIAAKLDRSTKSVDNALQRIRNKIAARQNTGNN